MRQATRLGDRLGRSCLHSLSKQQSDEALSLSLKLRRRSLVVVFAMLVLAGSAYAIFWVTHVPQSVAINEKLTVQPTQLFRLIGPPNSELFTMTLRGNGVATISAPGAALVEPKPGALALMTSRVSGFRTPAHGVDIRITNDERGLAAIRISVTNNEGVEGRIEVQPRIGHDNIGLAIKPFGATLSAVLDFASAPPRKAGTGPFLMGENSDLMPIGRSVIHVPEGTSLYVGGSIGANLLFNIGSPEDRFEAGGVAVRKLEIASKETLPTSLACGEREGQRDWSAWTGNIDTKTCDSVLRLQRFKIDEQVSFVLSGQGFFMKDRTVSYWPLMSDVASNVVLQTAFTSLVTGLVAWVAFWLGFRKPKEG